MHVLGNMVQAVKPGGLVLDLQVVRVSPRVEADGRLLCEIDGEPLFRKADAATAAIERLVVAGGLLEEAAFDHDVLKHYENGADLVDDLIGRDKRPPEEAVPRLRAFLQPCVVRERCRLRRLRVR